MSKTSPETVFSIELVNLSISISTNIFFGGFTYQRYKISVKISFAMSEKVSSLILGLRVAGAIFGIVCRIASLEGGNPGSYGHRGMNAADVGECDGLCRFGIDLYVVMAAFGE